MLSKNKENLFYTYLRLYPGKADVIQNAMEKGKKEAEMDGITGETGILEYMESEILEAVN